MSIENRFNKHCHKQRRRHLNRKEFLVLMIAITRPLLWYELFQQKREKERTDSKTLVCSLSSSRNGKVSLKSWEIFRTSLEMKYIATSMLVERDLSKGAENMKLRIETFVFEVNKQTNKTKAQTKRDGKT